MEKVTSSGLICGKLNGSRCKSARAPEALGDERDDRFAKGHMVTLYFCPDYGCVSSLLMN
jgi:hypothetical protein